MNCQSVTPADSFFRPLRVAIMPMFVELMLHHIQINALKHHAGYIRNFIAGASGIQLPGALQRIGESLMDIYYGELTLDEIKEEMMSDLTRKNICTVQAYTALIKNHNGFYVVVLSDGSKWVMRIGTAESIIHIHPGRYSPQSLRTTANMLKTAIACVIARRRSEIQRISTEEINYVRTMLLSLSPVDPKVDRQLLSRLLKILDADASL